MKLIVFAFLILCLVNNSFAQCPDGGVVFLSQEDLDQFMTTYPNCEEINGLVSIFESDVSSLAPLQNIKRVNGNFNLNFNFDLEDLAGLENLEYIEGQLTISNCPLLEDFLELNKLTHIGGLIVSFNDKFESFDGLQNVLSIPGQLIIQRNKSLINIDALSGLRDIQQLRLLENEKIVRLPKLYQLSASDYGIDLNIVQIIDNISLESLEGLDSIQIFNSRLDVIGNDKLKNLEGLEKSKIGDNGVWLEISENDSLLTLEGLGNMDSIVASTIHGNLYIRNNSQLGSLIGLNNLQYIEGDLEITGNASLIDISTLSQLNTVGRSVLISDNSILESLNGLENINPEILESFSILDNESLSYCSVKSVCDRLDLKLDINVINNSEGCNDTLEIKQICLTSITENLYIKNVHVFPNPTNGIFSIDIKNVGYTLIYDLQGKIVKKISSFHNNRTLDISDLAAGMYLLKIISNDAHYMARITKK